jgi:hypothetical protein
VLRVPMLEAKAIIGAAEERARGTLKVLR